MSCLISLDEVFEIANSVCESGFDGRCSGREWTIDKTEQAYAVVGDGVAKH